MNISIPVVFVTGGAGFIGSALVRHMLEKADVFIVNIDKLTYAGCLDSIPTASDHARYFFSKADICDAIAIRNLFDRFQPRYVMNLAAESHVDRSIDGPGEFLKTNVIGTYTLLQEALRHWRRLDQKSQVEFRFHHVSTDEVYGSLGAEGYFTEESSYSPNSPYSATKAASDHLVRAWHETYGLPSLITNCSNNYGPYHFPEKLIPHIIIRALRKEALPVYGDGQNVRDWLFVEDHVEALRLVIEKGSVGQTYNIGGRNERTNLQVVYAICDLLDELQPDGKGSYRRLISFVPDRPGHDRRYAIDASKIERELHWKAMNTFESGLAKTVRWYLENQRWWETILTRGYSPSRIGVIT